MSHPGSSAKPRISIGLPVYNGADRINTALDSVLAQEFTDFEVVISDNASTDRTETICRAYAQRDQRVRYYRNETNIGVNPNHDRVFELARGKYFAWFADDLEYLPGMLSRCLASVEAAPSSVVLVYPLCELVGTRESLAGCRHASIACQDARPFKRLASVVSNVVMVNQFFGLAKREALEKTHLNGLFPSSDYVLLAELAMLGQIRELPELLLRRRIHTSRGTASVKDDDSQWKTWAGATKGSIVNKLSLRERLALEYFRAAWRSPIRMKDKLPCLLGVLPVYYARIYPGVRRALARARSWKRKIRLL